MTQGERDTAIAARKSLVARVHIPAGTQVTPEMVTAKRPGVGLSPSLRDELAGTHGPRRHT